MPDLFFGRPVGYYRSFSLRPTYDNPSDYSRQFSIDPLGLISLSQTGDSSRESGNPTLKAGMKP